MRRSRVQSFEITADGSLDLPDGAVVVSLVFESEGPYGYEARPVSAWVEVPRDRVS